MKNANIFVILKMFNFVHIIFFFLLFYSNMSMEQKKKIDETNFVWALHFWSEIYIFCLVDTRPYLTLNASDRLAIA